MTGFNKHKMSDMDARFPGPDIQLSPEAQQLEAMRAAEVSQIDPELQVAMDGFQARAEHVMSV